MVDPLSIELPDEAATVAFGEALAGLPGLSGNIFLHGELGAGKTTLVRGFLQALGHRGTVKSPTYTLIEPYQLNGKAIYHLDIYRLGHPEELDYLGVRDLLDNDAILLIEWPERASGALGKPNLEISLEYSGTARRATVTSPHTDLLQAIARMQGAYQTR